MLCKSKGLGLSEACSKHDIECRDKSSKASEESLCIFTTDGEGSAYSSYVDDVEGTLFPSFLNPRFSFSILNEGSGRIERSGGIIVVPEGSENVIKYINCVVGWYAVCTGICNAYIVVGVEARNVAESVIFDGVRKVSRSFTR